MRLALLSLNPCYDNLCATFYNSDEDQDRTVKTIESGFNGNMAFWKYCSITQKNLQIKLNIKNIGDYPATQIEVANDRGEKIENTNVLHSICDSNDKKYILSGDSGILIICIVLDELFSSRPKEKKYFLNFNNPFGSSYSQEITIKSTHPDDKIIQIDAQCNLNIHEDTHYG